MFVQIFEWLGSGIGRCSLAQVCLILLEEMCHWEWALEFHYAQARSNGFLSSPAFGSRHRTLLPFQVHVYLHAVMPPTIIITN